jgi:hypothetical protein
MKKIRIIDCGYISMEVSGILLMCDYEPEVIIVKDEAHLKNLLEQSASLTYQTLLFFDFALQDQLGENAIDLIPKDNSNLKTIWSEITPKDRPQSEPVVAGDPEEDPGPLIEATLRILDESPDFYKNVLKALRDAIPPQYDDPVCSGHEFFAYNEELDIELHLPMDQVRDLLNSGDLKPWLEKIINEAEQEFE